MEQYDLTGPNAALDEKISRSYFICVEKCDKYAARTLIEGKKIMGKESGELEIDTSYVPYMIAKANYRIIYLRRNRYAISVPRDVDSVRLLNHTFLKSDIIENELKVDAIEKIIIERSDDIELDLKGNRIKLKDIPPHNKVDSSFYKSHEEEIARPKYFVRDIIQELRDKLVTRPQKVSRTIEETFNVDIKVILRTFYTGTFTTDEKEKKYKVDSVTGKLETI